MSADLKKFFEEVSRHGKKYSMRKGKESKLIFILNSL